MDAVMVGLGNTLRVAVAGIILATVVGTIVGIARLSRNWLVRTGARLYVEFVRNVPLLVIVIFTYLAVFLRLPRIEDSAEALGGIVSVRGVWIPWYEGGDRFATWLLLLAVAAAGAWGVRRWRQRVQDRTGDRAFGILYGLGVFAVGATVSAVALGGPIDITIPDRDGRLVSGGIRMAPEFAALLGALVVYTASHIAEIVRGSIQSVDRGQNEAAQALALSGPQRMRLVILPQALRVAIPPLANQYLNLTKNSSLAVAIAYVELTKVTGDLIGNGAPAPQSYGFLMLLYLMISLVIAAITNLVNRRLRLVER
jgi:general L-amino acid transport system permease protein